MPNYLGGVLSNLVHKPVSISGPLRWPRGRPRRDAPEKDEATDETETNVLQSNYPILNPITQDTDGDAKATLNHTLRQIPVCT